MAEPTNGVRMMLHDGSRLRDDRPIPKKFNDLVLLDVTRKMYDGSVKGKSHELGTEVKAIGGVEADNNSGFQVYIALIKNERVIQMGLPYIETDSGEKAFLNAETLRLGNLEGLLSHLPPNVEIGIVWRLDKNMTQDIEITDKTILSSMNKPSQLEFSLLKQEQKGCGGTINQKLDLIADITDVSLFCGEESDPIRISTGVLAPIENIPWDSFGSLFYPAEPLASVQPQQIPRPSNLEYITELTVKTSWKEDLKTDGAISPSITLHYLPETASQTAQHKADIVRDAAPSAHQHTQQQEFKEEESMIIRLLMNPTERKLWGKLYGLPVEEEEPIPAMPKPVRCSDIPSSKKTPFSNFKTKSHNLLKNRNFEPKRATASSDLRKHSGLSRQPDLSHQQIFASPRLMSRHVSKRRKDGSKKIKKMLAIKIKKLKNKISELKKLEKKLERELREAKTKKEQVAIKRKLENVRRELRKLKEQISYYEKLSKALEAKINAVRELKKELATPMEKSQSFRIKKKIEKLENDIKNLEQMIKKSKTKMFSYFLREMLGLYKKRTRAGRARAESSG